jgi:hypothetical protein
MLVKEGVDDFFNIIQRQTLIDTAYVYGMSCNISIEFASDVLRLKLFVR